MNADNFRNKAALWRQRASERTDPVHRARDLLLAEEYERLADSLNGCRVPAAVLPESMERVATEPLTDLADAGLLGVEPTP